MEVAQLVATSVEVGNTRGRKAKVERLAGLFRDASPDDTCALARVLAGELPTGKIGVGPKLLQQVSDEPPADTSSMNLASLCAAFQAIGAVSGTGSKTRRETLLRQLLSRLTAPEQGFVMRLLFGELRQGASSGLVADAIARAHDLPPRVVRRAAMLCGDLGRTAEAALLGEEVLAAFTLELFQPLSPMLASPCDHPQAAIETHTRVRAELKLDGARIQVHRKGDRVAVYTRQLRDVSRSVPEVVEAVLALDCEVVVLDGEAICLHADGRPMAFQDTMRRFGRSAGVDQMRVKQPIQPFFFDILHLDGEDLLDAPLIQRAETLNSLVPASCQIEASVTESVDELGHLLDDAMARGHEGLIAKQLDAPWSAGSRGKAWLKLKPAITLDLVILAAEWGSGRREGWLSNLHLGARDPAGGFVMLGKTFKGLTDEMLAWQTEALLTRETHRNDWTVFVRPEIVVEIAFNEVQRSPKYPGGMALRFARVKAHRPDKLAAEADTVETVRSLVRSP